MSTKEIIQSCYIIKVFNEEIQSTRTLTQLFRRMRLGDPVAANQAYESAYQELLQIAARLVRRELGRQIEPSDLVHETFYRNLRHAQSQIKNRQQFYSLAANAMRNVLIDLARKRLSAKRGSGQNPLPLEYAANSTALASTPVEMISLDRHLSQLEKLDPAAAQIFSLRFFLGYTTPEAAELLEIHPSMASRNWKFAKSWLRDCILQDLIHSTNRAAKATAS